MRRRPAPETRNAGAVYRALAPAVLGYLRSQRLDDPEDVLGDVFLDVAKGLGRFTGDDEALRRWVFTIAHNRVVDEVRRRSRRREDLVEDAPEQPASSPDDPFDPTLVAALHALTDDQREVVLLRFVADLSIEEVAAITKRTTGAVKALQHRALATLEKNLEAPVSPEGARSLT